MKHLAALVAVVLLLACSASLKGPGQVDKCPVKCGGGACCSEGYVCGSPTDERRNWDNCPPHECCFVGVEWPGVAGSVHHPNVMQSRP